MDKSAFFYELGYKTMLEKLAQGINMSEVAPEQIRNIKKIVALANYGATAALLLGLAGTGIGIHHLLTRKKKGPLATMYENLPTYAKIGIPAAGALGLGAAGTYALTRKKK